MPSPPVRIALVLHPTRDTRAEVRQVLDWCAGHDAEVITTAREGLPEGVRVVDEDELVRAVGAVAIGGDGTILGALRLMAGRGVPVLGVNRGNVGFLAEVDPPHLPEALQRLTDEDFDIEARPALRVTAGGRSHLAFNDVVLIRLPGQGFGTLRLRVQGQVFAAYRCDALVFATPMGSTAYNYAAGGPLISPSAEVMSITPVAPVAGPDRTVVVTPGEPIELTVQDARMALEADGAVVADVAAGDVLSVGYVPAAGQLIRFDPDAHSQRQLVKLSLQDLPLPAAELRRMLEAAAPTD